MVQVRRRECKVDKIESRVKLCTHRVAGFDVLRPVLGERRRCRGVDGEQVPRWVLLDFALRGVSVAAWKTKSTSVTN